MEFTLIMRFSEFTPVLKIKEIHPSYETHGIPLVIKIQEIHPCYGISRIRPSYENSPQNTVLAP